jgi:tryptophan-rich sensory protein
MQTSSAAKRTTLILFAAGTLTIGLLTAWLSFTIFPLNRTYRLPAIYPPLWMFWCVWMVLYPTMGLAAGHIWLKRKEYDVRGAIVFYLSILATNFMFLPVANISNGNPAVMTFMDINGVVTSLLLGWVFSKYSKPALYFLLPLIIWMPITAAFKIALWASNPVHF